MIASRNSRRACIISSAGDRDTKNITWLRWSRTNALPFSASVNSQGCKKSGRWPCSCVREIRQALSVHSECLCYFDQLGERSRSHFPHHPATMALYRDLLDAEFASDLLVHQAGGHESHHFQLARGESLKTRPHVRELPLGGPPLTVALERGHYSIQHVLVAERLDQEIHGPSLHGPHRHWNVAVPGHEDDGNGIAGFRQLGLQAEAA